MSAIDNALLAGGKVFPLAAWREELMTLHETPKDGQDELERLRKALEEIAEATDCSRFPQGATAHQFRIYCIAKDALAGKVTK